MGSDGMSSTRESVQARSSLWNRQLGRNGHIAARLNFGYLSEYNKYLRLLPFCDSLPPDPRRDAAADGVEASLEAIYLTSFSDNSFGKELLHDMNAFAEQVVAVKGWYKYGNLFDFCDYHLEELLLMSRAQILQDPASFEADLRKYMYRAINVPHFIQKLGVILEALCGNSEGHSAAFSLLKYMLKRLCRPRTALYTAVRSRMQRLLEGCMTKDGVVCVSVRISSSKALHFLDYASACRHLRAKSGNFKIWDEKEARYLLRILQRRAWQQTRSNTYLICASHLPVELTECIFEHTLQREGIPIDACDDSAPVTLIEDWPSKSSSDWKHMF